MEEHHYVRSIRELAQIRRDILEELRKYHTNAGVYENARLKIRGNALAIRNHITKMYFRGISLEDGLIVTPEIQKSDNGPKAEAMWRSERIQEHLIIMRNVIKEVQEGNYKISDPQYFFMIGP